MSEQVSPCPGRLVFTAALHHLATGGRCAPAAAQGGAGGERPRAPRWRLLGAGLRLQGRGHACWGRSYRVSLQGFAIGRCSSLDALENSSGHLSGPCLLLSAGRSLCQVHPEPQIQSSGRACLQGLGGVQAEAQRVSVLRLHILEPARGPGDLRPVAETKPALRHLPGVTPGLAALLHVLGHFQGWREVTEPCSPCLSYPGRASGAIGKVLPPPGHGREPAPPKHKGGL